MTPGSPLVVDGPYTSLGAAGALLSHDAPSNEIRIRIRADAWTIDSTSTIPDSPAEPLHTTWNVAGSPAFAPRWTSADRIGPRTHYQINRAAGSIDPTGEFTPYRLHIDGARDVVGLARILQDATSPSIHHQVEAWLGRFSTGIRIQLGELSDLGLMQMSYTFAVPGRVVSDDISPPNVGFGISYVLPVIHELLSAQPGELVIVDAPEGHLHPRAQRTVAALAAAAAADGVQVLLETHSDHVVNEARIAVRSGRISPDDVRVVFAMSSGDPSTVLHQPTIDSAGRLSEWPNGFLDEWLASNLELTT
jgi:predicted ATPase